MCVDVLKLSPILFNDTNLPPLQFATVAVGWKMPPKIGDGKFWPKIGSKLATNSLSHTQEWMELPDLAVVIHSVRSCDTNCNLTQNFDTNSFSLRALSAPNQPYISINWNAAKDKKKQLGTKFEDTFYFFSHPVSLELKHKIRAWKYASDLARIQTLNLSKLWW